MIIIFFYLSIYVFVQVSISLYLYLSIYLSILIHIYIHTRTVPEAVPSRGPRAESPGGTRRPAIRATNRWVEPGPTSQGNTWSHLPRSCPPRGPAKWGGWTLSHSVCDTLHLSGTHCHALCGTLFTLLGGGGCVDRPRKFDHPAGNGTQACVAQGRRAAPHIPIPRAQKVLHEKKSAEK